MTRVLAPTAANLLDAAQRLRAGELVGMPTETVYGLAGNALDSSALAKIFAMKDRPTFDPLIVHIAKPRRFPERDLRVLLEAPGLVDGSAMSEKARARAARLASAFWPGPLTLVLPRGPAIPDLVTAGLDTVAIRMPAHEVAQSLLALCGLPLAAPSANRFGRISPTKAEHVVAELGLRLDVVLDGGPCAIGVESTVVAIANDGTLTLLRPGGIPVEAIAAVAGEIPEARAGILEEPGKGAASPGMSASHYAPAKPLVLLERPLREMAAIPAMLLGGMRIGLLVSGGSRGAADKRFRVLGGPAPALSVTLSHSRDLSEAASRLFGVLRQFDAKEDVDLIVAEPPTEAGGLAHAIRDRLTRASRRADRPPRT